MNIFNSRTTIERLIHEYILDINHRTICRLRLLDGLTYEQIGEEVNLSARQVRRIITKCKQIMVECAQEQCSQVS